MHKSHFPEEARQIRSTAMFYDSLFAIALAAVLYGLVAEGVLPVTPPECRVPVFDAGGALAGDDFTMGDIAQRICMFSEYVWVGSYLMLPYIILAILMIISPMRATLPMRMAGFTLKRCGEQAGPGMSGAARFVLLNPHLVPLYFLILFFAVRDYNVTFHEQTNGVILMTGLAAVLMLAGRFVPRHLTLAEWISGLDVVPGAGPTKQLHKIESKARGFSGLRHVMRKWQGPALMLAVFGWQSFNVLREGATPEGYLAYLYQRPPVAWQDNGYFVLTGLDAPREVDDFYAWGRERVLHDAAEFAEIKRAAGITDLPDMPNATTRHFKPDDEREGLSLSLEYDHAWVCIYATRRDTPDEGEETQDCPDEAALENAIAQNRLLYDRFVSAFGYRHFSLPDTFILDTYPMTEFMTLSRVYAAETVMLARRGAHDAAIQHWADATRTYAMMARASSSLLDKAFAMLMVSIQMQTLETLLLEYPGIAETHGDDIRDALPPADVRDYRAGRLMADDWRRVAPWVAAIFGNVPYMQQKMFTCLKRFDKHAEVPPDAGARSYSRNRLCDDLFPPDSNKVIRDAFFAPGNPVSNTIYPLLVSGVLKGEDMILNLHREAARARMAHIAVMLVRDNVMPDAVVDYLAGIEADYRDPFGKQPFGWDAGKGMLYSKGYPDREGNPLITFRVNLGAAGDE